MMGFTYQYKLVKDLIDILDHEILSYAGNDEVTIALNSLKQKFNTARFKPREPNEDIKITPWRLR
jgi:hypothetical protein